MLRLTELAHHLCEQVISPGDVTIDATVGNGHDTRFLAEAVGSSGLVFGFDIQPEAIASTREQLSADLRDRVHLIEHSHERMDNLIPSVHHGRVKLVMFNLGYLPGGNKQITTQTESTLRALDSACRLLHPDGLVSLIAYPGHDAGSAETEAVERFLQQKSDDGWNVTTFDAAESHQDTPRLYTLSRHPFSFNIPD